MKRKIQNKKTSPRLFDSVLSNTASRSGIPDAVLHSTSRWLQQHRALLVAISLVLLLAIVSVLCRPLFAVDETRYVTVAWEMWYRSDWLVPTLNGEVYTHKPPLLFWLYQIGWKLFGVNNVTPRLVSPFFAILSLILIHRLYQVFWPQSSRQGNNAPLLLAGFFVWIFYAAVADFEVLLNFWVLLTVFASVRALTQGRRYWFYVAGTSLGLGVLSKGPVVIADSFLVLLFMPWWRPQSTALTNRQWYIGLCVAVLISVIVALCWLVPAMWHAGYDYAYQLVWHQNVGRAVKSFAHARPWFWYLLWLPLMVLPWILLIRRRTTARLDSGARFCLIWSVSVVLFFSSISGKQIHYVLPVWFALALLFTRILELAPPLTANMSRIVALLVLVLAAVVLLLPEICQLALFTERCEGARRLGALPLFIVGSILLVKNLKPQTVMEYVAAVATLAMTAVLVNLSAPFARQNLEPLALWISAVKAEQSDVAYIGRYHGEFNFFGRLDKPLTVLAPDELDAWLEQHPHGYWLVTTVNELPVCSVGSYPYRGKTMAIVTDCADRKRKE